MSNDERLLALLRSLPGQSFDRESEFIRAVIPTLSDVLGYSESETFYEWGRDRYRADVVLGESITSEPWVVIEVKTTTKPPNPGDWIYQLKRYLAAFDSNLGIILSPTLLILVTSLQTEKFDLQSIDIGEVRRILQTLGRKEQTANPKTPPKGNEKAAELIEAVERAETNDQKGKALEALARFLLESVPSLRCKYANLQTRSSEIDLVIEYDGSKGALPLFEELGRYCLVECKNWSRPVGVGPVRDFMGKLDKCRVRFGLIFSRNGVTGVDSGADALREIQSRFDRDGGLILVFSLDELKSIKTSSEFYVAIDLKADRLRFDAAGF